MHATIAGSFPGPTTMAIPPRGDLARCLKGIRQGDPTAAQALYEAYGASIRLYYRHHGAVRDLDSAVFSTLVEAVRSVRELDMQDPDELTQTIRHLCAHRLFEMRKRDTASKMTLDRRGQVVNRLFTALNCSEREVLLRSSVLLQGDSEIARETSASLKDVRRAHAKARVLYRLCCDDLANPLTTVIV